MSSSAGAADDAIGERGRGPRIDGLDRRCRGAPRRLRRSCVDVAACAAADRRGAGQHHAREAAAAQPILVVHRRLVHEIGERAFGVRPRGCGRRSDAAPRRMAIDA